MSLILFGRSPFINEIDVHRLIDRHTTIGFNTFADSYPVDHVFMFDRYFPHQHCNSLFVPHHWKEAPTANRYFSKGNPKPFIPAEEKQGFLKLAYKYFSPSIALNWALLQGFKNIYLVGIDHVETDTQFQHFDGVDYPSKLIPCAHKAFKQYVYECAKRANIYQTNPAVKDGWELPFVEIESLYV